MPILSILPPLIEKQIVDDVILSRRVDLLMPALVSYGVIWALAIGLGIVGGTFVTYLAERVALKLRRRLFSHASALAVAFAQREHSARTMSLFTSDVPAVSGLVGATAARTLGNVVTVGLAAAAMFALNWQLAIATTLAPLAMAAVAIPVTSPLRPASRRAQEKAAELVERIQEHLAGIREVVAFGRARLDELRFVQTLRELLSLRMRLTFMQRTLESAQSIFSLGATLAALGFGAYLVIEGRATFGTVIAIRSLFTLVFVPASQLLTTVGDVQRGLGSLDRLYAFLDETPRVPEHRAPRALGTVVGAIAFNGVTFGYEPGRPVLQGVSLSVRPGECVALVGPSGAGKSTLVSLIPRFYDPSEGMVRLDGVDLREIGLDDLRRNIGLVFQNTFLFAGTIRENIGLSKEAAREDEIVDAARAANAWEFIQLLPQGLDTNVGERGVRLSAAHRHRQGAPPRPSRPHPGRADVGSRRSVGAASTGGTAAAHARQDQPRDRSSTVDDHRRGSDRRA
jgi:ABC-type multidrug transport system fused ATPase/permease subunit